MRFFSNSSGATWDTTTKPKGYDPISFNIWNCNSTGVTVYVAC
jgi:hypothetical protein